MHNEFPLPSIPVPASQPPTIDPEVVASTPPTFTSDPDGKDEDLLDTSENEPPPNSQSSTKENDVPTDIAAARTPVPAFQFNHPQQSLQPQDSIEPEAGALPPDLLSLYTTSRRMLESDFAHSPPYTIQRLAELVLYPKRHYRFLPAYLRALDRIVSVSSPVSDFPLPTLHSPSSGGFLTNGDTSQINGISEREGLGSDESLGGALLTPIPWLRNHALATNTSNTSPTEGELHSESTQTIDGPNGAGSIETVSVTVNGVPSATSAAHTSPAPASPTLSDQSDASASSSSSPGSTEAQLREQGAVTQGELLRQEQEAGVIPLTQTSPRRTLLSGGAVAVGREAPTSARATSPEIIDERADEQPHARGPEEIGPEDMGPQHHSLAGGLDMEAAVGRGRSKSPPSPERASAPIAEAEAELAKEDDAGEPGKDPKDVEKYVEKLQEEMEMHQEEEAKDADGDVVVADADGRPVEDKDKMEITGDLGGADASDTTAL